MATIDTNTTQQDKQDDQRPALEDLYKQYREEGFQDEWSANAKRLFAPDCRNECDWLPAGLHGEYLNATCSGSLPGGGFCPRRERIWKNGSGPSGGWAAGKTNDPESTAAKVLHVIDVLELAGVTDITAATSLNAGAVTGCLRRLSSSKSGQAWVEKLSVEGAFGRRVAYRLTRRGELRLDWDRDAGLAPEVDNDDDDNEQAED